MAATLNAPTPSSTTTATSSYPPTYSNPDPVAPSLSGSSTMPSDPASPSSKRQRLGSLDAPHPATEDTFITDEDAVDSGADDDDGDKPKSDKKAGRRKIKIEFIQDKSRRHITFSKRKAGIMKKAYELSTLTGTQVLLLVVSETGLVYTFTTAKLQPLVTQPEGKNLIQACLNAPHGTLPSSMPVGTTLGRSNPMSMPAHHAPPPGAPNVPGGLAISGGAKDGDDDPDAEDGDAGSAAPADSGRPTRKRRRASSSAGANTNSPGNAARGNASPGAGGVPTNMPPSTSPHARAQPIPPLAGAPPALAIPSQPIPGGLDHAGSPRQQGQPSPNYTHTSPGGAYGAPGDPAMYGAPGGHAGYSPQGPYGYDTGAPGQNAGMAAPWGAPPVQQGSHYARR